MEVAGKRGRQPRFIEPHALARELAVDGLVRRGAHRTAMNEFARALAIDERTGRGAHRAAKNTLAVDKHADAPTYLCWYAEEPVGKTALLADYVAVHPPRGIDILSFFVSAAHGTDRRSAFEAELVSQLRPFLGDAQVGHPSNATQWHALFAAAAKKSWSLGRTLLLVVDGLDDDLAWAGLSDTEGSIAALLPRTPPEGMGIVVSVRKFNHFPADLHTRHPLRRPRLRHALPPVSAVPQVRRTRPTETLPGSTVTELLAVAGGGLRITDFAELTSLPTERLDRLLHGPEGRFIRLDDPVSQTYGLAGRELVDEVRESLGCDGMARNTRTLVAWSARWRDAGWPDGTPPYPLAHQLRVLTDVEERSGYLLDLPRLRRLAETASTWAAVEQLNTFGTDTAPTTLDVLIPLAATRELLWRGAREVPPGAPALFVRLGDPAHACGLARSTPRPADKALRLAEVAVELADKGLNGAEAVAQEAADWLGHRDGLSTDPGTCEQLVASADSLAKTGAPKGARALLHAVLRTRTPGVDALTAAAGLLHRMRDEQAALALFRHAQDLSEDNWRSRAAAVEIWGTLGQAVPSLRVRAADAICAACGELEPTDGLGAIELLAVAAVVLAQPTPLRYRKAVEFTTEALTRIHHAWADPGQLSDEDRAYLRRELGGTLARLTQAVDTSGRTRDNLADIQDLLRRMPEQLRTGVLGDDTTERARLITAGAQVRTTERARTDATAVQEAKNAARRQKHEAKRKTPLATQNASRRPEARLPAGLTQLRDDAPEHLRLLHRAHEQQLAGDQAGSRTSANAALRCFPIPTGRPLPDGCTIDLAQALGTTGDFDAGQALTDAQDDPADRVRHLAALSLGCSLGNHADAGLRHAVSAARLLSDTDDVQVANLVARALAWAGETTGAVALASGNSAQKTQALTAVAAGLVHHHPEDAARIAEPLVHSLERQVSPGSRNTPLLELAALLLAYPDIRNPDPLLREALTRAAGFAAHLSLSGNRPLPPVLTVLEQLGCLQAQPTDTVVNAIAGSRRMPPPGPEFALLYAMDGYAPALLEHADSQPLSLWTAATYFTNSPVPLAADTRAKDKTARTCLALAQVSDQTAPPGNTTAAALARRLVEDGNWTRTIPLLPHLAPDALHRLAAIAGLPTPDSDAPRSQDMDR